MGFLLYTPLPFYLYQYRFPQIPPKLSFINCSAVHQGALPYTAEAYQVMTDSPGGVRAEVIYTTSPTGLFCYNSVERNLQLALSSYPDHHRFTSSSKAPRKIYV